MEIKYEEKGQYIIVRFEREKEMMPSKASADRMNDMFSKYFKLGTKMKGIAIDLNQSEHLYSVMIKEILKIYGRMKEMNKETHMIYNKKGDQIHNTIQTFSLDLIIGVRESIDEILEN